MTPRPPRRASSSWTLNGVPVDRVLTGLQLRLAVGALAVLVLALVASAGAQDRLRLATGAVVLVIVVGAVVSPTSPLPTVFVVVVALMVLDAPVPLWMVLPVGALLQAVHVGLSWCAVVPVQAHVEATVLVPTVRRWATTQVLLLPVWAVLAVSARLSEVGTQLQAPVAAPAAALAGGLLGAVGVVLVVLTVVLLRAAPTSPARGASRRRPRLRR